MSVAFHTGRSEKTAYVFEDVMRHYPTNEAWDRILEIL